MAKRLGSRIVGNGETINVMRAAGVPEHQLIPVSGGERIPLFTGEQWLEVEEKAAAEAQARPSGSPGPPRGPPGPPQPDTATAPVSIHAWPSLHCLMPAGDHQSFPEVLDSGQVYTGATSHACTLDITRALQYGLGSLIKLPQPPPMMPDSMKTFITYLKDKDAHKYSFFDGGQIMYNLLIGNKVLLWNGHLGGYEGIMNGLEPKPDFAVLAIAGRANLNGRPFDGSAAEFAVREIKWVGEPPKVAWCLHDRGPLKPFSVDITAATSLVHEQTQTKVVDLKPATPYNMFV